MTDATVIMNDAKQLQEKIVCHRRKFHENPEIHLELPLTRAYVMDELRAMGYEPIENAGGILATVGGKKDGKVFLIRGDMDALPLQELVDVEFKSKNENMHACGHDLHTAMLLGAAAILKQHEDEISGTIKLMFQAAEETLSGAKLMVDAGILENPTVDAAMMIHVASALPFPCGSVILPSGGPIAAGSDNFVIRIKGKGGHGAAPEMAIDPLNIAAHICIALQEIPARELAFNDEAVINICMIKGGETVNVIPDSAEMRGTFRSFSPKVRENVKQRIIDIAEGTAKIFRGTAEVEYITGCPAVEIRGTVAQEVTEILKGLLPEEHILTEKNTPHWTKMAGSEDFAYVAERVPAAYATLVAGSTEDGYTYGGHNPFVRYDENALSTGAAVYAYSAMRWLDEHAE